MSTLAEPPGDMTEPDPVMPVEPVSVGDLVRRRTGTLPDPWQLALVQRSAVWDEVRVARLLDSLLAGYPIGALLVCRVRQGGAVLDESGDGRRARSVDANTSQLLDGQQRVHALTCLFSDAGDLGRFYVDMTAKRAGSDVVIRRRDKRTVMRYIRWERDIVYSDASDREHHLDLGRFASWAEPVGDDGVLALAATIAEDPSSCLEVLRAIDHECAVDADGALLAVVAERTGRLLEAWAKRAIPVQHLTLDEPSDVLQVFTRINLEGVRISSDDVFFAGVKTAWPDAEQTLHHVQRSLRVVNRMGALRVLARLGSVHVEGSDMVPLQIDRLNGAKGDRLVSAMKAIVEGAELARMQAVSHALIDESGLGHALRLVDTGLLDHVLGWAAVNSRAEDSTWLREGVSATSSYLVGASSYRWVSILRDSFDRLAFREALAAGVLGEPFPLDRIVAATRRQWEELRRGQRSVKGGAVPVDENARLFLSILQAIPFDLPAGRIVEWDHIYPQAKASHMRWHGPDGHQRRQNHPRRARVWHGANLWALDRDINHAASDIWPSSKFALLESLPDPAHGLPSRWPEDLFLSDVERAELLRAEALLQKGKVEAAMQHFERYVSGRAERIRGAIVGRYPGVETFASDAQLDAFALEDRPLPPQLVQAPIVTAKPTTASEPEADGLLSPDEMRAIAYEFLRDQDPERDAGVHYYDILHAVEAFGRVAHGDAAPRMHGVLSNAPTLFTSLGSGRFSWKERATTGRRYWVMRTDRENKPRLWAEVQQGRLRQGWGWADDQDLREVRRVALSGGTWSDAQRAATRNRRMLSAEPNSIKLGDLIVLPHLPDERRYSIVRVAGPYEYGPADGWTDYRHILPVELLSGRVGIDVNDPRMSPQLRRSLRNQHRMWSIDPVGPDVESLLAAMTPVTR